MMKKLKTHKGIAKRFKITKSGKVKHSSCGRGHLLTNKKSKKKRFLRKSRIVKGPRQKRLIKQQLPYS